MALEFRSFTYTDPISPIPINSIIEPRIVSAANNTSLSYESSTETFSLAFEGVTNSYSAADLVFGGSNRTYRRDEFEFNLRPILDSGTEAIIIEHSWPEEAYTYNTQLGTAKRTLFSTIGNISVEQTEIESPIRFESVPGVVGGGVYMTDATILT